MSEAFGIDFKEILNLLLYSKLEFQNYESLLNNQGLLEFQVHFEKYLFSNILNYFIKIRPNTNFSYRISILQLCLRKLHYLIVFGYWSDFSLKYFVFIYLILQLIRFISMLYKCKFSRRKYFKQKDPHKYIVLDIFRAKIIFQRGKK